MRKRGAPDGCRSPLGILFIQRGAAMMAMSQVLCRASNLRAGRLGRPALLALVTFAATLAWCMAPAMASAAEPLSPYLTVSGEPLALSVDALGDNNPAGGPIRVE